MAYKFIIYGLTEPDGTTIRYVGKSTSGLKRVRVHAAPSQLRDRTHKISWIKALMSRGLTYGHVVLEDFPGAEDLQAAEQFWIAQLRGLGCDLTNLTKGGDGHHGPHAPETRAKMSIAARGRPKSAEAVERSRLARLGRDYVSPEGRARIAAKLRGLKRGPEFARRVSAGLRGKARKPSGPLAEAHRIAVSRALGGRPFVGDDGRVYQTQMEASRVLGIASQHIGQVLLGRRRATHGRTFRYIEEAANGVRLG